MRVRVRVRVSRDEVGGAGHLVEHGLAQVEVLVADDVVDGEEGERPAGEGRAAEGACR